MVGRRWAWVAAVVMARCLPAAPSDVDPWSLDASVKPACAGDRCDCGGEGTACCVTTPRCGAGLRCEEGVCARPAPRCVASGIFDPTLTRADFEVLPSAPGSECRYIPRELLDTETPGTFTAPARAIGRLDCEGLTPGPRVARMSTRVRARDAVRVLPEDCGCSIPTDGRLTVTHEGGASWELPTNFLPGSDRNCTDGPTVEWSATVTVPDDGTLSLRVDFPEFTRAAAGRALFLRGAVLELDGGAR